MRNPVNTDPWKIEMVEGSADPVRYIAHFKTKKSAFAFQNERLEVSMGITYKLTALDVKRRNLPKSYTGKWEVKYNADQYDPLYPLNNLFRLDI